MKGRGKLIAWVKENYLLLLLMAAGLAVVAGYLWYKHEKPSYNWDLCKLGDPKSEDPFGTQYFDRYLQDTYPAGFQVVKDSVAKVLKEQKGEPCNYLIVGCGYGVMREEVWKDEVWKAAQRGNHIVVACPIYWNEEYNSIQLTEHHLFDKSDFHDHKARMRAKSIATQKGDSTDTPNVYESFCNYTIVSSGDYEAVLADQRTPSETYVHLLHVGKGTITHVGIQALVSNYTLSDPQMMRLTEHTLHACTDTSLPMQRIWQHNHNGNYSNTVDYDRGESMFYVFLTHSPLKLTLVLLLTATLMMLVFNIRRRQRAEEPQPRERNSSLSYIKHMATLFNDKTNHQGLLRTEMRRLMTVLRREFRFEQATLSYTLPSQYASLIAARTGIQASFVREKLEYAERLLKDSHVSQQEYIRAVKGIRMLKLDGSQTNRTN